MIKAAFKAILILTLLLAGAYISNAQSNSDYGLKLGIKAGANLANLKNTDGKRKIGPLGGIFSQYRFSEKFAIRSEAMYSVMGARKKGNFKTVRLNYLNVLPVLAKFYPVGNFSIEVGPYGGFLLNKKGGDLRKSDCRKIDYGAALGIGCHLTNNLEIGARYYVGVRDITKTTGSIKNKTIQLALSCSF